MKKKKFWVVNALSGGVAEILLYGFIGQYEEIDDAAFLNDLRMLEMQYPIIHFRINCGGGDVYKGLAIFNAIRNSRAETKGFVDGIAASMGAVVCSACKTVEMSKYARYMTHRVKGGAYGDAEDMRNYATQMEALEGTIASIIAEKTGLTPEEAKAKYITSTDRWISADQALQEKLIDGIYDSAPVALPANNTDPHELFNAYQNTFNITITKTDEMKQIALALGMPENSTEAEVLAKLLQLKTERDNAVSAVKEQVNARAKTLVDTAIVNKQLVEADRAVFEPLAQANYDAAVATINKIPAAKKPTDLLNRAGQPAGAAGDDAVVDSWEKLTAKGTEYVATFKKESPAEYKAMYEKYFGIELPGA